MHNSKKKFPLLFPIVCFWVIQLFFLPVALFSADNDYRFAPFRWNGLHIDAKAGMDYYYIDPGQLMPESGAVKLESQPFYYYDLRAGINLNFFGFSFRFKDNIEGSNFDDSFINQDESSLIQKKQKSREKVINLIGYLTPLQYKGKYNIGIYTDAYIRTFQTGLSLEQSLPYTDRSGTRVLQPDQDYTINMFYESYAAGMVYSLDKYYGNFRYLFRAALGYRFTEINAPHFLQEENSLETISSRRHSVFLISETNLRRIIMKSEANFGISRFTRPNGEEIEFYGTQTMYFSGITDTLSYKPNRILNISAYVGASGFAPLIQQTAPSIALSIGFSAYQYYKYIYQQNLTPMFGSVVQIAQYLLIRSMNKKMILYEDIIVGAQAGLRIDL